jgi:hypothetical protein
VYEFRNPPWSKVIWYGNNLGLLLFRRYLIIFNPLSYQDLRTFFIVNLSYWWQSGKGRLKIWIRLENLVYEVYHATILPCCNEYYAYLRNSLGRNPAVRHLFLFYDFCRAAIRTRISWESSAVPRPLPYYAVSGHYALNSFDGKLICYL